MRYLLLLLAVPMYAQFGAAKQVVNGTGAPASAKCASANNVGLVYARKDGAAAYSTFYVCSNSAASTYIWELMGAGGGGGSGTVTSVDATGGVQTASGAAITATGTVRGAHIGKADTATTYTFLTGDRGKVVTLCNAAGVAVTLPNAGAGFEDGWFVVAKNICAGDVVITPTTATISGAATATISNGEFLLISSNGTNYEGDGNRTVAGSGITLTKARTGVTAATDTAVILSRATDQAGTDKYCRSTSGDDTWVCTLTPTLTAYTTGGCVVLNPDTANTGAATLNVDALGAKAVVTHAGAALTTGDIPANLPTTLCYDGTSMVIQGDGAAGGTVTTVGFTGGLISIANPTTTPALTVAGTSGGIPYFSSISAWASSGALTAGALVVGGGAGAAPAVLVNSTMPNAGELWVGDQAANASATRSIFHVGDVAWASGSANGTQLSINATSGFTGDLINGKTNSVAAFNITSAGAATFASTTTVGSLVSNGAINAGATSGIFWLNRSRMFAGADGTLQITNNAQTDFGRLQFGLTTSAAPALKRSGIALQVRLADDSNAGNFQANAIFGDGTTPAVSSGTIGTGSRNISGFITSLTTGVYTGILTFNNVTAPVGWVCASNNLTAGTATFQTAYTTTTATLSGATTSGDVIVYKCTGF